MTTMLNQISDDDKWAFLTDFGIINYDFDDQIRICGNPIQELKAMDKNRRKRVCGILPYDYSNA